MRTLAIAAILVCSCAANKNRKLPEGRANYPPPHKDFNTIRPTMIAVMKVTAKDVDLARRLRTKIYNKLFKRNYSCLRLSTVDKNTTDGVINTQKLRYDATFDVTISGWKSARAGRYVVATGEAKMVHRLGEVLWTCSFSDYPLETVVFAGKVDITKTITALAGVILKDGEFPKHPEVPPPE